MANMKDRIFQDANDCIAECINHLNQNGWNLEQMKGSMLWFVDLCRCVTEQLPDQYRLSIDTELLAQLHEAIELAKQFTDSEEYSDHRENLQARLDELHQSIGWSMVYNFRELNPRS